MDRKSFIQKSGGVFRSAKGWSWLSSREKRLNFWVFYRQFYPQGKTIYGPFPIRKILHNKTYSIEHIIPVSTLKSHLKGSMMRGASLNPFNLVPSHQKLNQARGRRDFDLDNDRVAEWPKWLLKTPQSHEFTGLDKENQWVIPTRSRGDIARAILYMKLCYPLDHLYSGYNHTLIAWAQKDVPSEVERDYNKWVQGKWAIQNPLIEEPEILFDPTFEHTLKERFPPCQWSKSS
ncbi:MAG: endonuclease [Myxococcota bacterium]|nr:endonuclease [Myxococcota bacterium]